jgi:pimeloyl-ACP methyl ester carboxylesterase
MKYTTIFIGVVISLILSPSISFAQSADCGSITSISPFTGEVTVVDITDCDNPFNATQAWPDSVELFVDRESVDLDTQTVALPNDFFKAVNFSDSQNEFAGSLPAFQVYRKVGEDFTQLSFLGSGPFDLTEDQVTTLFNDYFSEDPNIDQLRDAFFSFDYSGLTPEQQSKLFEFEDDLPRLAFEALGEEFPLGTYYAVITENILCLTQTVTDQTWLSQLREIIVPTAHAQFGASCAPGYIPKRSVLEFEVSQADQEFTGASSVLFLPGIQASRLYKDGLFGSEDQVWEPTSNEDVDDLRFDSSFESVNIIYTRDAVDNVSRAFGLVDIDIYKNLLDTFNQLDRVGEIEEFLPFAYDWRYDVFHVATEDVSYTDGEVKRLKDEIERLAAESYTKKVSVIAHSNGGLVLRALLASYDDQEFINKIDQVIMVGTPLLGAPKTIASLLHGYGQGTPGQFIIGDSTARRVSLKFPGAYGLLPSDIYLSSGAAPTVFFDTSESTAQFRERYGNAVNGPAELEAFLLGEEGRDSATTIEAASTLNETLFSSARSQSSKLDDFSMPDNIDFYTIVGTGKETEVAFEYREFSERTCRQELFTEVCETEVFSKPIPILSLDGDGTVPAVSAAFDGITHYIDLRDASYDHKNLTESPEILEFITDLILDESVDVNNNAPTYNTEQLLIGIHSPMNILVTDSNGNQTGVVDEGILTNILNSSYRELAGSKFVTVPKGTNLEIIFTGTANGGATVTVDEFDESGRTQQRAVVPIPIVTSTTLSTLVITDTTVSNLETDVDGDGTIDEIRTPDGELVKEVTTQIIRFTARDIDRNLPDGDKRPELVADIYKEEERIDTVELASKIHWGGRVQEVIQNAAITATGYKVNRSYDPAVSDTLSTASDSNQLHQDGLRYNKSFGIDKSGKRKNQGFPGDEGERSAKDLNWRELLLFDVTNYLTKQFINSVELSVTPRRTDTFTGQLLVLTPGDINESEYIIADIIPLTDLSSGTHTIDLTTPGTAVALNVSGGNVQVGVSLEVNN